MQSKRLARAAQNRCVACGACENVCPTGAVAVWRGCWAKVDPQRCVGCGLCARICPAGCITLKERAGA